MNVVKQYCIIFENIAFFFKNMKPQNKHGGSRIGSGRPKTNDIFTKSFRVNLTEEQHRELLSRGGQEAIRAWLDVSHSTPWQDNGGIRTVSLFSGAGGLDIGFEKAGYKVVFANELDHFACETYRANPSFLNPSALVEGDISDYMGDLSKLERIDAVIGGPPCQGFSVAGKMNPDDHRSQLVWKYLDVVKITKPKVFVMENVKALGELSKWKSVREKILKTAHGIGYTCFFRVLNSADYGVPEQRERVFFIGIKGNADESKFDEELRKHLSTPKTVREVLNELPEYGSSGNPVTCTAKITFSKKPVMRKSPYAGMIFNGAGRPIRLDGVAQTLPASMGGNKTPIIDQCALKDKTVLNWVESYHARLSNGEPVLSGDAPSHLRRLSIVEAAAIQTFPLGYKFVGPKTKQYCQIGNAVPCHLGFVVATCVKSAYL